jgi:hypothetical protein
MPHTTAATVMTIFQSCYSIFLFPNEEALNLSNQVIAKAEPILKVKDINEPSKSPENLTISNIARSWAKECSKRGH